MTELSRDQNNLLLAERHVREVEKHYGLVPKDPSGKSREELEAYAAGQRRMRKNYGSLCHSFPVLVRRAGLIQAVGFLQAKGSGDSPSVEAYQLLLPHVAEVVGRRNADANLASELAQLPVADLMIVTRRLLDAWIHYKHFAESILDTASASDGEED